MKPKFRSLRTSQLDRLLQPLLPAKGVARPQRGWIRATREATGITVRMLAKRLGKAPSVAAHLEKSEAEYRITLGKLRDAADALGCQLIYALVPKNGSVAELAEAGIRAKAAENVLAVEHSMALEDQAVGDVERKIEDETKHLLGKNSRRKPRR
jgi:predicted DNA-binding mobile mystery protein A